MQAHLCPDGPLDVDQIAVTVVRSEVLGERHAALVGLADNIIDRGHGIPSMSDNVSDMHVRMDI